MGKALKHQFMEESSELHFEHSNFEGPTPSEYIWYGWYWERQSLSLQCEGAVQTEAVHTLQPAKFQTQDLDEITERQPQRERRFLRNDTW